MTMQQNTSGGRPQRKIERRRKLLEEYAGVSDGSRLPLAAAPSGSDGRKAIYGVRPEHFVLAESGADAIIQVVEPTGSEIQVVAKLGAEEITAVFRERHQFKPGDKIRLMTDPRLVHLFDETSGQRLIA